MPPRPPLPHHLTPRSRSAQPWLPLTLGVGLVVTLVGCGRSAPTDVMGDYNGDPEIAGVSVTSPDAVVPTVEGLTSSSTTTTAPIIPQQVLYTVQPGDTLSGIASSYGVSTDELAAYNGITDPNSLRPGQELAIPPATPAAPAEDETTGTITAEATGGSEPGGAGTSDTTTGD